MEQALDSIFYCLRRSVVSQIGELSSRKRFQFDKLAPSDDYFQLTGGLTMHVKFAELPVKNQDRALAFYTTIFGMALGQDSAYGGHWRWIELTMQGAQTNLIMSQSTTTSRPESPTLVFIVDDVDELHSQLVDAGVEIRQKPEVSKWNPAESSALFYDSEDNLILITSTKNQKPI